LVRRISPLRDAGANAARDAGAGAALGLGIAVFTGGAGQGASFVSGHGNLDLWRAAPGVADPADARCPRHWAVGHPPGRARPEAWPSRFNASAHRAHPCGMRLRLVVIAGRSRPRPGEQLRMSRPLVRSSGGACGHRRLTWRSPTPQSIVDRLVDSGPEVVPHRQPLVARVRPLHDEYRRHVL
jgi:hypothetical protein